MHERKLGTAALISPAYTNGIDNQVLIAPSPNSRNRCSIERSNLHQQDALFYPWVQVNFGWWREIPPLTRDSFTVA